MTMACKRRRTLLFLFLTGILFFSVQSPAYAIDEQVEVSVSIEPILIVEYTGDPNIYFEIDAGDLDEGSEGQVNLGNINWWSNVAPWKILIERTEWDTNDGDEDLEFWLQVKYGPPDNDDWTTVPVNTDPGAPAVWINGSTAGSGTYWGVDWKIKDLTWDMEPGTYWCTVTISIVAGS